MEIQVEKLRQALGLVAAAIPRGRASLPITTSVLFSEGKLTATNLEFWVSVELPELVLTRRGGFVLPHRALAEALKYTPGRENLTLVPERERVVLQTAGSRLSLVKPGRPRDFPPMPQPAGDGFRVDGDRLVGGLLQMLPYVATDSSRPVLTGVSVKLAEDLELAAADGFRLAVHQPGIQLSGEGTGHVALVPGDAVKMLGQLWRRGDKPPDIDAAQIVGQTTNGGSVEVGRLAVARRNIRLVEDGNHISFSFGSIGLTSVLLQGEFPQYQQFVPETQGGRRVRVHAEELLRAINQVAQIASGGNNSARLRWASDRLVVSAHDAEVGDVEVIIMPAVVEGEETEIAFNLTYLQQYLRGKTDIVTIATAPGDGEEVRGRPGVFYHRGAPMVVIMPMAVGGDTEQPPEDHPDLDQGPAADGEPVDTGPEEQPPTAPATEEEPAPRGRRRRGAAS